MTNSSFFHFLMKFLQINDIIANNRINRENIIQNSIIKGGKSYARMGRHRNRRE